MDYLLDPQGPGEVAILGQPQPWWGGLDFKAAMTGGEPALGSSPESSAMAVQSSGETSSSDKISASTGTSGVLNAGDSITGYVNALKDHDWLKISLTAGQTYRFNLNAISGSKLDAFLTLRNSTGSALASNDDVASGNLNSQITFTPTSTGTYHLDAGAFRDRSTGEYQLLATQLILPAGYSTISGYGEASVERAIEKLLNITIADQANTFSTGGLYGLDRIGAPEAWSAGYTGSGMVVAVVDTGVDRDHSDLDANIWSNAGEIAGNGFDDDGNGFIDDVYGWNFHSNTANTLDDNDHGTHVAGTIAAENNGFGATGVAYDAKIMAVKVLNSSGSGYVSNIANGIRYAADNGADVINLSLGGGGSSEYLLAVQYAWNKGVAVIMAAGNDGGGSPIYPAAYANQYGLAIGAISNTGAMASFSNRAGTSPLDYVTAAGVGVYSTIRNNSYATWNGTSMATPQVAGAMALLMQANRTNNKGLSLAQLEELFTSTASNSVAAGVSTTTTSTSSNTSTRTSSTSTSRTTGTPKALGQESLTLAAPPFSSDAVLSTTGESAATITSSRNAATVSQAAASDSTDGDTEWVALLAEAAGPNGVDADAVTGWPWPWSPAA